jgi:hypothetical protein
MAEQIAYDQIGGIYESDAVFTRNYTAQMLTETNAWTNYSHFNSQSAWVVSVWLPEPYDITGFFIRGSGGGTRSYWTSVDTTTGADGTWVARGSFNAIGTTWSTPEVVSYTGLRGIRFSAMVSPSFGSYGQIHLYGTRTNLSNTEVVEFWHPTNDTVIPEDWLDNLGMYRSGTFTKQFRLKNLSASSTANDVTLSTNVIDDAPQPLGPEQQFDDGGAPANPLNIGTLAPGAISSVITYTVTKNITSSLGAWYPRVRAITGLWT